MVYYVADIIWWNVPFTNRAYFKQDVLCCTSASTSPWQQFLVLSGLFVLCEWLAPHSRQLSQFEPRNLKGGIRSLFDPCVNAMGRQPYCSSHMEGVIVPSDLARSFGAICAHRYRVIHCAITNMRVRFEFTQERQLTHNKIIWQA